MVLVAVMAALVDYAFKSEASAHFKDSESLVAFLAHFMPLPVCLVLDCRACWGGAFCSATE